MKRQYGFAVPALIFLAACSSKDSAKADAGGPPPSWNADVTPPSDSVATAMRAACAFDAGALPLATQGSSQPNGSTIPIDTIVIIMMENRSFDHYFQDLPNVGQTDVDVAPEDAGNYGADGGFIPFHHDTQLCLADMSHEWIETHQDVDNGLMDGFGRTNDGTSENPTLGPPGFLGGDRSLTYYTHDDLPFMYWAAANYSIGDRYFAAIQGPTWPNRMYLYAATSFGLTTNNVAPADQTTLMTQLNVREVPWAIYADGTPGYAVILDRYLQAKANIFHFSQFASDVSEGKLPNVVFIDPGLGQEAYDGNDEHPPAIMQVGQQWLSGVVQALTSSPQWPHMAIFIDYDENGGIYDHVPPVAACPPDDNLPQIVGDDGGWVDAGSDLYAFDETGVRVPFVVISPYAKQNYVSHLVYDHTSVVRFVEARYRIPAMTRRDANALAPWDMFDFTSPPRMETVTVPTVAVDDAGLSRCEQTFLGIPSQYSQ